MRTAGTASPELDLVRQKCDAATLHSRRIHGLIQLKLDEVRTAKHGKNTRSAASPTSPTSVSSSDPPANTRYASFFKSLFSQSTILMFALMLQAKRYILVENSVKKQIGYHVNEYQSFLQAVVITAPKFLHCELLTSITLEVWPEFCIRKLCK